VDKEAVRAKRKARRMALQAVYQWQMAAQDTADIEAQFKVFNNLERVDVDYFSHLLKTTVADIEAIDAAYESYLDRDKSSLNPIELAIIRLSVCELCHCPELPWRVVLDEAVNMGREYGSNEGHKYVNGILNQAAKTIRAVEIDAERTGDL